MSESEEHLVTSRFENIEPPKLYDPFNTNIRYINDDFPDKINLKSKTFKTNDGQAWTIAVLQRVQNLATIDDCLKNSYLPTIGLAVFNKSICGLLLGESSKANLENKVVCIQTFTICTSLIIISDFLLNHLKYETIYLSKPYSHKDKRVLEFAGFKDIRFYRYWSTEKCCLDFDGLKDDLEFAPENSVIFLYAFSHNPSSYDLNKTQWKQLTDLIKAHNLYPLFICDNLGLASGDIDEDAYVIRLSVEKDIEFACIVGFEFNFSYYSNSISSLLLYTIDSSTSLNVESLLTNIAAALYSSPPANLARIMSYALNCEQFKLLWLNDIKNMSDRINLMRKTLRSTLELLNTPGDWAILTEQRGPFAYIEFTDGQIKYLMDIHHIYLESFSRRINMSAINDDNVNYIGTAINDVVKFVD